MTAFWFGVLVSIATGALVNEFCDVSPWLADKIARRAARLWSAGDSALEVEWAAVIQDCPGKLTKLFIALRFGAGAASKAQRRWLKRARARASRKPISRPGATRPIALARKLVAAVMAIIAVFALVLGIGMASFSVALFGLTLLVLSVTVGVVRFVPRPQDRSHS
ncbi:hypothetical protein ACFY36_36305 [Actinoplanes sp. NPDC000266]